MSVLDLSIREIHEELVAKRVTPLELVQEVLTRIKNDKNNAFEYVMEKEALEMAESLKEPEADNLLWGIPFVIKDNISTKDVPTTASSNILNGYVPVYNATVVNKLLAKKAIPVGKTTLDELAMGGTGTSGHLGMTYNPYDPSHERLVGGSSAGSASAVASGIVPFALASDTGDSIRKPASFAGLVGIKPTWGRVSRYGLFAFTPSLDTLGVFARSVEDASIVLESISGHDENDHTSSTLEVPSYVETLNNNLKGKKVAVIKEIIDSMTDKEIVSAFKKNLEELQNDGLVLDYVSVPKDVMLTLFPTYFVISSAVATSNNANLDGIKFGPYYDGDTYQDVMSKARTKGFGEAIKRRFILGSFALMKDNQHDLFLRAQKNRRRIVENINKILKDYDYIIAPAAPSIAPKKGESLDKLSDEYLIADNHMVIANFAGLPSITVPNGFKNNMPFGLNITGRLFDEAGILNLANAIEKHTNFAGLSVLRKDK